MKREDRLVLSHRPYAVDLGSLDVEAQPTYWDGRVRAVWFRRRKGVTVACIGYLWDFQHAEPGDAREFLERHDDGRHGGTTLGRWDGQRYWGAQEPAAIEEHLALLRPMLANYPDLPAGFDGWWVFEK